MNICVACGGTGGHIFPGLATAKELRSRGHNVTLCLAGRDVETESIDGWDGDVVSIQSAGFQSGQGLRAVSSALRIMGAIFVSWKKMRSLKPDVVLAMGSYSSVGPVIAARLCRIPVVLHEANAIPGRAISFLARFADKIGTTFPSAAEYLDINKVCLTGFPLRNNLQGITPQNSKTKFDLLVMGGSQGAHALNEIIPEAIKKLQTQNILLKVTHLTGSKDADSVEKSYRAANIDAEVHAFCNDMKSLYIKADFAIARAGAATCTELAVCGIPALLIPLPSAARNHQMLNALAMTKSGAISMQPQQDITVDWLASYLKNMITNPGKISEMRNKLKLAGFKDGTGELADLVEEVSCS